jgi:hypothetical protein
MRGILTLAIGSLAIVLGLANCTNSSSRDRKIVNKVFYDDGSMKIEQEFNSDSVADGFYRLYFPSGEIKIQAAYTDGKQVGKEVGYYESGKVYYETNYLNGLKNGFAKWFYENGSLLASATYNDGKEVGEGFDYHPNKKLKHYGYSDFDGNVKFQINYDSSGNKIETQGTAIIYIEHNGLDRIVGDTLSLTVVVATPPNASFHAILVTNAGKPDRQTEKLKIDQVNNLIEYTKVLDQVGSFNFTGTYYLNFEDKTMENFVFAGIYAVKGKQ